MPQERSRTIPLQKRVGSFQEVHLGLSRADAIESAVIFLERERAVKGAPCPLTGDHFAVLRPLAKGDVRAAAAALFAANPLAGITARLAPEIYPETQVYNRKAERISLRGVERFLADHFKAAPALVQADARKKLTVAVIGAGPAGLMAAACLLRQGVRVTLFDSASVAGGSLACRYPEFRLPGRVVSSLIDRLAAEGVVFKTNVIFPREVSAEDLFEEGGFAAILLTTGAGLQIMPGIPGENAAGVIPAVEALRHVRLMKAGKLPFTTPPFLGKKVVVLGHNETSFDAARTAVREGCSVTMVIAGSETDIRVPAELVREAAEEGVKFKTFANPVAVLTDDQGCVAGVSCRHLDYRVDQDGHLTVVEDEDAAFDLEADTVLVAGPLKANTIFLGDVPGLDLNLDGSVWVRAGSSFTSVRKIFAAGRVTRPEISLLDALVDARRAAMEIAVQLNT